MSYLSQVSATPPWYIEKSVQTTPASFFKQTVMLSAWSQFNMGWKVYFGSILYLYWNGVWWIWMDRTYWTNKWNPFIHVTYNKIKSAVLFTWSHITRWYMMTSSNGNIFRVTGPLWGEPTGHRWITHTMTSDEELWCFFDLRLSKHSWRRWFETPSPSLWKKSGSRCTKLWTNDTPYHTYTDRERCHCSYWWAFYNTTPP